MNPQLQAAQPQVDAVFNPAIKNIQQQIPAVQQLYSALLQGLQAQTSNQVNNVISSANQRGVGSAGIEQGAQQALQGTMGLQGAQLGSQQAGTIADLSGQIGKAQVGRGQAVYNLADSLQKQSLEAQSNKQAMTNINRKAALEQQGNQQSYNLQQARYQRAQAEAAARAYKDSQEQIDLTTVGEGTLARQLKVNLNAVKGKDKRVSPESLAKAYNDWTMRAGLEPEGFWRRFQGLWNSKQRTYEDQFNYFVNKGV